MPRGEAGQATEALVSEWNFFAKLCAFAPLR